MSFDPGFRGKYLLSMWVEDLSNLARSKFLALPLRPLDYVRAVPATAENITKQEIRTRTTIRLRLCIFGVSLSRSDLGSVDCCYVLLRLSQIMSYKVKTNRNYSGAELKLS